MRKAIQFGAGNIGRGFIGYLLSNSGYHVIFADINRKLVDALNKDSKYMVEIVGDKVEKIDVENISAIYSLDERLIDDISEVNILTTAVGPNVLETIAPTIAKGIQRKYKKKNTEYLNIIPCENLVGAADRLKVEVQKSLDQEEKKFANTYVGFINCVVDRIVPPMAGETNNITHVMVEEFSEWVADVTGFKGDIPRIQGMELTDNLLGYIERKIFTLNTGHAIGAYLGYLNNHETIRDSIMDLDIQKIVLGAMRESGEVLIKRHGFQKDKHEEYIQKILGRFSNPYLKDHVTRVGRQPLRKLGNNDRLIKPLKGTIEYGLENENLIKGIAAALSYDYPGDKEAVKMQKILRDNPKEEGIAKITGLDSNLMEVQRIYEEYNKINREAKAY